MNLLEVRNVSKSFGESRALKEVSLNVRQGEILSIIGPSGAGKTTLLKLMNLLLYPDQGKIFFEGIDTEGDDQHRRMLRRKMGMVFQHPVLFDTSVFENVSIGLWIRNFPKREINVKVKEALEYVGLIGFDRRKAATLSAGEAQRVSLARTLVLEPKLLLLDEPTSNLDPANTAQIEKIITRVNTEMRITVVLATHNLLQAKRLSNRAALLWNGELIEFGETREVFENPRDERTAFYLSGKMVY